MVLTIDPTWTPHEVAAAYRTHRRTHFGRLRRLSRKHALLAVFAATYPEPSLGRLADWNRRHRPYGYRALHVFNRDCQAALARLTEFGDPVRTRWGGPGLAST